MTEKLTNNKLYEIDGETYSLEEIKGFIEASKQLARQTRFINALKMRCSDYSKKIGQLESEIADMKFTRKYLTSEEAGKAFARELLGKPMTPSDIAEEQFIENGEKHYEKTWNLACEGDDF